MAHKNFKSLKREVLDKAKIGMKEEVLPMVQVYMYGAIEEEVYSVYTMPPRRYVRRHERGGGMIGHGGLNDTNNMVGFIDNKTSGFNYRVENITMPDTVGAPQEYLTPLIVMGQLQAPGNLKYHEGAERTPYGKGRDFITATIKKLKMYNSPAIFLENYMKKK